MGKCGAACAALTLIAALASCSLPVVSGHGAMNTPPCRNAGEPPFAKNIWAEGCQGEACMWFSQGCYIGCSNCSDNYSFEYGWDDFGTNDYANPCDSKKVQTLPEEYWTYPTPSGVWAAKHRA